MSEKRLKYLMLARGLVASAESSRSLMGTASEWLADIGEAITPEAQEKIKNRMGMEIAKLSIEEREWHTILSELQDTHNIDSQYLIHHLFEGKPLTMLIDVAYANYKMTYYKAYIQILEDFIRTMDDEPFNEDKEMEEKAQEASSTYSALSWFMTKYGHVSSETPIS